jgi:hypothetical protein
MLLKRMLCVDVNKRATVDEVLDIVSAMREVCQKPFPRSLGAAELAGLLQVLLP